MPLSLRHDSIAALAAATLLAGCASGPEPRFGSVQAGADQAWQDFATGLVVSWDATVASLQDLGYPLGDQTTLDRSAPEITVRGVAVRLVPHDEWTRIHVRVADMETKAARDRAIAILEEIGERLEARYRGALTG